ncbi:hypothetical protein MLD38_009531 [Melastoma candidum]|uniref:Uncharacterized protein n=1 Tax=Melastoma candidum TaxID=119954 RepID=A0ACB9RXH6_9MYRT|nr:hypothetical protein MLD38_009531 [Melastoma candidum]
MGFCFRPSTSPPTGPVSFVRHFSYKDIKKATDGFCRIIYVDCDGAAYRATFRDVGVALVKEVKAFHLGNDVFYQEVQLLGRLHHRHLLPLKGFSMGCKSLLVYENVENGSLRDYLNDPLKTPLNWRTRRQIASEVAAALEYLLLFNDPPIYRVSISSSSVLLDENFGAKLSRVGVLGSSGHAEGPTYSSVSKDGSDTACNEVMFQLGILILELITGQSSEHGGSNLIEWVQQNHTGSSMHNLLDPDLGNDYNSHELKDLLNVARQCIKFRDKPTSTCVARLLRYLQKKNNTPVS